MYSVSLLTTFAFRHSRGTSCAAQHIDEVNINAALFPHISTSLHLCNLNQAPCDYFTFSKLPLTVKLYYLYNCDHPVLRRTDYPDNHARVEHNILLLVFK